MSERDKLEAELNEERKAHDHFARELGIMMNERDKLEAELAAVTKERNELQSKWRNRAEIPVDLRTVGLKAEGQALTVEDHSEFGYPVDMAGPAPLVERFGQFTILDDEDPPLPVWRHVSVEKFEKLEARVERLEEWVTCAGPRMGHIAQEIRAERAGKGDR